jgi:4-hydroxy-3-methylbut-2-enyl diphosphate reductase IspH
MDDDARAALSSILAMAHSSKIGVAGRFMPDAGVSASLSAAGIFEHVEEADFFRFARVVIPYAGISPRQRREWEEAGHRIEDMTSPKVRRAQVALGLLRMEGAQTLVIGRHEDAESLALAGAGMGTKIIEDTTDTARLVFSSAFGVICQTNLSPRRVSWLVQQLRHRYHDARVTFLDTSSPAMAARDEALERQLADCEQVVIVGEAGESSCEALAETALRRGKQAVIVSGPEALDFPMSARGKIAFTAGAFATDQAVRAVVAAMVGK